MNTQIGPGPAKPPGPPAGAVPPTRLGQAGLRADVQVDADAGVVWLRFNRPVCDLALEAAEAHSVGRTLSNGAQRLAPAELTTSQARMLGMATDGVKELALAAAISMRIGAYEMMVLIGQLQLALRHPKNRGPAAEVAEEIARFLQRQLAAHCPQVAQVLEAGWDPSHDIPVAKADEPSAGPDAEDRETDP